MKRLSLLLAVLLIFIVSGVGWGQTTDPTATNFDILQPSDTDARLRVAPSTPYFMSDSRVGTLLTAWSHTSSIDSMETITKGQDHHWVIRGVSQSQTDSLVVLSIEEYVTLTGRKVGETKYDTLDFTTLFPGAVGLAYNHVNIFSVAPTFNITTAALAAYTKLTSRWAYYIYYSHEVLVTASNEGAVSVYEQPDLLDSLTILAADSGVAGDVTTFTGVLPGRYGYLSLFLDATTNNGNTAVDIGIVYQVKVKGGEWSGDIGTRGDSVFVVYDSVSINRGIEKAFQPLTIPADSLRFGIRWLSNKGMNIIDGLKALWRD